MQDFKVSARHKSTAETALKEDKLAAGQADEASKVRPDMDKDDPLAPGDFIEVVDDSRGKAAAGGKVGSGTDVKTDGRIPDAKKD